jgi:predicted regulator of Ras-like GTPase activity (Roadblock/LC7/MglB family)
LPSVYRVNLLEDRLQSLTESVEGILGAVVVSVEGFVVASYAPRGKPDTDRLVTNTPQLAAMSATLMALGEQTLTRLAQGKIERLMIEGEDGAMLVYPINQNAAVAVLVAKWAKIGLALLASARAARDFALLLEGNSGFLQR